jgi:hypothetical protein
MSFVQDGAVYAGAYFLPLGMLLAGVDLTDTGAVLLTVCQTFFMVLPIGGLYSMREGNPTIATFLKCASQFIAFAGFILLLTMFTLKGSDLGIKVCSINLVLRLLENLRIGQLHFRCTDAKIKGIVMDAVMFIVVYPTLLVVLLPELLAADGTHQIFIFAQAFFMLLPISGFYSMRAGNPTPATLIKCVNHLVATCGFITLVTMFTLQSKHLGIKLGSINLSLRVLENLRIGQLHLRCTEKPKES